MDILQEHEIKIEIKEEPLDEFSHEDGNDSPHTVHSNEDPFQIEIKLEELTNSAHEKEHPFRNISGKNNPGRSDSPKHRTDNSDFIQPYFTIPKTKRNSNLQ